VEIDPSAFSDEVWRKSIKCEGPPLFLIDDHFIRSIDRFVCVLLSAFSKDCMNTLQIGENVQARSMS
jgi:hypothetical protein